LSKSNEFSNGVKALAGTRWEFPLPYNFRSAVEIRISYSFVYFKCEPSFHILTALVDLVHRRSFSATSPRRHESSPWVFQFSFDLFLVYYIMLVQ
jgi:hypothetical protein